jgi:2-haloacid dehalogenase
MSTIEAVIFDIGNVLIEWHPERWYDRKIGPDRRRTMFEAVDLHAMNDRIDRGEDFRGVVYETAEAYPEFRDEIRMWHDNWLELAAPLIPHSLRLMEALQAKGVPVFALSNFGIGTYEVARPRYPFLGRFDQAYISGHIGVTKPDPEIYRIVEARSGLDPDALLFTDDREENIAAARSRGWQTHLFESPEGWAARLVSEGLLSDAEAA